MSINVRVKNNTRGNGYNGFDMFQGVTALNGCCSSNGIAGTSLHGVGNSYGQHMIGADVFGLQQGLLGTSMLNGMQGDLSLLGSRAGLNLGLANGVNQYGFTGTGFLGSMSKEQAFVASLANINLQLAQAARQIAMIDATLISEIAQIAYASKALAVKILEVAIVNIAIARTLVRIAAVNVQLAAEIATIAMVNVEAAIMKLQTLGLGINTMGYTGTTGIQFGTANDGIRMNVHENSNAWVVEADVAGLSIDDVDITVDGHVLVIEGLARKNGMSWRRQFAIGTDIKVDDITARVVNGVLTVVLPKCVQTDCVTSAVRNVTVAA